MARTGGLVALLLGFSAAPALAVAADLHLERVVVVMRHGVRPPTRSAEALAPLADKPWPDDAAWGAKPGELTPRGAIMIRKFGRDLRAIYADEDPGHAVIWADGADERTRETARALARGLAPDAPPAFGAVADGTHDPLFSGLGADACPFDPNAALASVAGRATQAPDAAITRLQAIVAPNGCSGGGGVCLQDKDGIDATARGLKMKGAIGDGASLAEDLLLEYENGLPSEQFGWGRATRADLDTVMPLHRIASDVERATPYVARRRAFVLSRFILATLRDDAAARPGGPSVKADDRLVMLVGHDTNLANLGGVFGLRWTLPGQPDYTAPGTAIAFERWRDARGRALVRVRIFYTDPDQVRSLSDAPAHQIRVTPAACAEDGDACALETLSIPVERDLAEACPGKS